MKTKHWILITASLSFLYLVALIYYSQVRGIDPDEGYYPLAARLVAEGKAPYSDFQFPQGALIPYVYSWVWAVHPRSLVAMRFLSAALGALTVFLWGVCLFTMKRLPKAVALAAFLIILLNPYWIAWHTVVKTFAIADLLVSGTIVCFYMGFQSGRAKWYVLAGGALGLCASARGLYGPLIPLALLWLARLDWKDSRPPLRRSLAYLAGALCGTLPMLHSFASDPRAFLFNNVQYRHLLDLWVSSTLSHTIRLHLGGVHYLFLRGYFGMVLLLAAVGGLSLWKRRKTGEGLYTRQDYLCFQLAFWMMLVYCATCLIPLPTFAQYFDGPLLPFLIFFVVEGLRVAHRAAGKWTLLAAAVIPVLCWHGVVTEANEFARPGLQLSSYRRVTETVLANSGENATVLSLWPGYVFESGRRCFPGAENEFAYQVARLVDPDTRTRFHLVSGREVVRAISTGAADIYIPAGFFRYLSFTMPQAEQEALREAVEANYVLVNKVDDVEIYRIRDKAVGRAN
jgi:hypothetical protein